MGLPLAYYGIDFPSSLTCRVVTANFWSQEEKPHRRAYSSKGMVTVIPPRLPPPRARGRALRLAVPAGGRGVGGWVGGWIRALVRGARGSACRWCDPSDPEPSERPWQASKQEPCPCSKGRCGSAGAGNSGAGESPGGAESPWRFWHGCCTQGPVGSTGPSELAASLTQGRGASKIETADKNQNFCLKSLAFAFIALPPGMGRFQGS